MEPCAICKREDHERSMSWITVNGVHVFVCHHCADYEEDEE